MKIQLELGDLKRLLLEQSELTAKKIANDSESFTVMKDGKIDKADILNAGRNCAFPHEVRILEKYLQ